MSDDVPTVPISGILPAVELRLTSPGVRAPILQFRALMLCVDDFQIVRVQGWSEWQDVSIAS